MKCLICKTGVTKKGKANVMLERNNSIIIVKSVPTTVCIQCCEPYFNENATHELYRISNDAFERGVEVAVIEMKAA